ncbi:MULTISPECIES: adenosyl-hopene transferase HpnH [Asaia]|uniref:Hopanoid biosynthesis associated radical SAM protein HpnH n=1 Tax=Asaia bogorensis NBRC 16594 TaxID=1231624 RepID=A0AAN4R1T4_9PROT|nr:MULTISPECIES: adenosyl-hopene transferase HpnH [Asaia]MDR6183687.1 hopanoid biosynthesis associated radical SAM protein HpnH [Asaia bogorensis NBRC 16594]NIE80154.1 adenosyl-hopene transferase HpnH [Asaia sp. As-1742]BAT18523.1 hopanoid biosynthesis associated radical SAM protein HpnH [Asaia bogorensis NBRC 16594]GBQ75048.1 iron-sulfur oxidoreductase [Asaia bogorensis NBRC 16594]GEL52875.1 hopanoid biosynthesis associated radical SAM protein HpnH [Asaia bogorensis NBRC 16594]
MAVPLMQAVRVGRYVVKQHLLGRKRYPLVLMLEPLFRCNLACAGCGKIDYPAQILNQRLSLQECLDADAEADAPVIAIAGGEPLLHKEMPEIVKGLTARKKYVYLCTNGLLLEKKLDDYEPNPFFSWDIHLDGDKAMHDSSVCQEGVYERAVAAIRKAKERGFRVSINCTLFDGAQPERVARFFDEVMALGVDGVMTAPGYAYERAPDQEHFLNRQKTKQLFRDIFRLGKGKKWRFTQSPLFLNFLAGNENYHCTPWGKPLRTVFGWQRPCYLLGEGYAKTFKELMDDTAWEQYGTGAYEKCADCMVHSGYESTAVMDAVKRPWHIAKVALFGPETEKPMVPEISLENQRPAEYKYEAQVAEQVTLLESRKPARGPRVRVHKAEEKPVEVADAAD